MADEHKAKGNAAFSAGKYDEAVEHFTKGIEVDPTNHVLYSNRSAANASLKRFSEAFDDANKTTELKPDWSKGYNRKGAALYGLGRLDEAIEAYQKGLEIEPSSAPLKQALEEVQAAKGSAEGGPGHSLGAMFSGPDVWAKIAQSPQTRAYLAQPDFVAKLQEVQRNPNSLNKHLNDPRMLQVLGVVMGINIQTAAPGDDIKFPEAEEAEPPAVASSTDSAKPMEEDRPSSAKAAPEPEVETGGEEKEELERKKAAKAEAQKEKELGTAAYKKKDFDAAAQHYTRAFELDDTDVTHLTNRAAVNLESGKFDKCIADCDKAVERARELRGDYSLIAKALTRKGNAYLKKANKAEDYKPAIEAYQKALTEHRNPDTLKRLNEAEKKMKDLEGQEYLNPELAQQEREKGNELFKDGKFADAVKAYTEALRRDPTDYRVYSNRAACYTKLMSLNDGLKDAEKCIELAPDFVKGYSRKGHIQFFMKDYEKALETYQAGLKHDPNNEELKDGVARSMDALRRFASGQGLSDQELKERQAKALQDPEVQGILSDPVMRQVLNDFESDPRAAQHHLQNAVIRTRLQKLINAGIIRVA
eukprot:jgi/Chlat1/2953/Chrsp2S04687